MRLDQAMRHYLEQFTLPGEAQQVDRIIQKFGHKYQKDNATVFNSSDGVYTLSFLLIMLQTDLHNPQVQEKMKLQEFLKLARSIEGENFTTEMLSELYHSIAKTPLAIHEKEKAQKALQETITSSLRKKQDLFLQETRQMLEQGKHMIQSSRNKS